MRDGARAQIRSLRSALTGVEARRIEVKGAVGAWQWLVAAKGAMEVGEDQTAEELAEASRRLAEQACARLRRCKERAKGLLMLQRGVRRIGSALRPALAMQARRTILQAAATQATTGPPPTPGATTPGAAGSKAAGGPSKKASATAGHEGAAALLEVLSKADAMATLFAADQGSGGGLSEAPPAAAAASVAAPRDAAAGADAARSPGATLGAAAWGRVRSNLPSLAGLKQENKELKASLSSLRQKLGEQEALEALACALLADEGWPQPERAPVKRDGRWRQPPPLCVAWNCQPWSEAEAEQHVAESGCELEHACLHCALRAPPTFAPHPRRLCPRRRREGVPEWRPFVTTLRPNRFDNTEVRRAKSIIG